MLKWTTTANDLLLVLPIELFDYLNLSIIFNVHSIYSKGTIELHCYQIHTYNLHYFILQNNPFPPQIIKIDTMVLFGR